MLFRPCVAQASIETLRKQDKKKDKVMFDGTTNPEKERQQVLKDGYEVRCQFEDRMVRTGWSICKDNRYAFERGATNKMQVFRVILQMAKDHQAWKRKFLSRPCMVFAGDAGCWFGSLCR
ncbi:MAG: hypothetical protein R3E67_08380 [Pseudomonadales bacterium]